MFYVPACDCYHWLRAELRSEACVVSMENLPRVPAETVLMKICNEKLDAKGEKLAITPLRKRITLDEIIASATTNAQKLRVVGWDEMKPARNEK